MELDFFEENIPYKIERNIIKINLYYFHNVYEDPVTGLSIKALNTIRSVIDPGSNFHCSLFDVNPKISANVDFNKIHKIYETLHGYFHFLKKTGFQRPMRPVKDYNGLCIRFGNVELRLINNYMLNRDSLYEALKDVLKNYDNSAYMKNNSSSGWFMKNPVDSIKGSIVNSGMYFDPSSSFDENKQVLDQYVDLNLRALSGAKIFNAMLDWACFLEKYNKQNFDVIGFDDFTFLSTIRDKNILIITPHAGNINTLYTTGDIFKIRNNMPNFILYAINSEVSLHPNRPSRHWKASFDRITQNIDSYLKSNKVNVFIAACGSYSVPLCYHVYCKYGIDSFCWGNLLNNLFGILDRRYKSMIGTASYLNLMYHRSSDLEIQYPMIEWNNIDGGTYN